MLRNKTTVATEQKAAWAPEPVWTLMRSKKSLATARNSLRSSSPHLQYTEYEELLKITLKSEPVTT